MSVSIYEIYKHEHLIPAIVRLAGSLDIYQKYKLNNKASS